MRMNNKQKCSVENTHVRGEVVRYLAKIKLKDTIQRRTGRLINKIGAPGPSPFLRLQRRWREFPSRLQHHRFPLSAIARTSIQLGSRRTPSESTNQACLISQFHPLGRFSCQTNSYPAMSHREAAPARVIIEHNNMVSVLRKLTRKLESVSLSAAMSNNILVMCQLRRSIVGRLI